jgi:hypothetical protein
MTNPMSIALYMDENVHRGITTGLRQRDIDFSGIIYAHKLSVSLGDCVRDLEIIAKASEPEEWANCVQYLP